MTKTKKDYLFPVIVLVLFLFSGLYMIRDYGVSADEHIQIDSGHVIWRYLCLKFNREVPESIRDVPDLHGFKNSYYGQAATFPTVILEAVKGFSLDSSTIIKVRHYWNFISYFIGLCCMASAVSHLMKNARWAAVWLLLQILMPRIFGDIFYNDRDIMLISWMMIFLAGFYLFIQRPGLLTICLCAAAFGIAVNTRIFGLTLLIFPFLYFLFSKNRKYMLIFVPAAMGIWFLLSPIAWDDPLHALPEAFHHFSTQQRYLDTGSEIELLFFGRLINETELPWYYIPMYMIVTTPLAATVFALIGSVFICGQALQRKRNVHILLGGGMLVILIVVPLVGIICHLTFYNGWRHFYFLLLPITWLSMEGIWMVWRSRVRLARLITAAILMTSFVLSAVWIVKSHPYQIIYINPVFRSYWIGKFDRDYWQLSTKEMMDYLLENVSETVLNVVDKMAFIEYSKIGFPPAERERFHTIHHSVQQIPFEYLFFNYSNELGDEKVFDYYIPIYSIKRDGIKLAEIFQRSHNNEFYGPDIIQSIHAGLDDPEASYIADNDYQTAWYAEGENDLLIRFSRELILTSFEIFPAGNSGGYRDVRMFVSQDGEEWLPIEIRSKGSNGIDFSPVTTSWLKLESDTENAGIREILFYGK